MAPDGSNANPTTATTMTDSLDDADYDPVPHLVQIFADRDSVGAVDAVQEYLVAYSQSLDKKMAQLLEAQQAAEPSVQRVARAHTELAKIFAHIETVRERAIVAEEVITNMTADIRHLDGTKRNLTTSMTMLKRLQMLTTAYEQLTVFSKNREYKEAAHLLAAVMELAGHVKPYRSIAQIASLSRNVAQLQHDIAEQIVADFEAVVEQRRPELASVLAEGCLVMDELGESYRQRLITWYCNVQLREYRNIFRGSDEAGSLDNISRRYSYLKRMLNKLEPEIRSMFPAHWSIEESLCRSFCDITREDYKTMLSKGGKALNVDLLLSALEQTMEFENFLGRKFEIAFTQTMSGAFEPYLSLWVESQDRKLSALVTQYANQMIVRESDTTVLPTSVDLFLFYRQVLAQSANISTGSQLLGLSKTFSKYLLQYADRALMPHVSDDVPTSCLIITTANYCYTTTDQLENRIIQVIDEQYKEQINFDAEKDKFLAVANAAVQALVRKVENDSKPAWREMVNTNWAKLQAVGDQSAYVSELVKAIEANVREVIAHLHKDVYVRSYCDHIVESTVSTFLTNIAKCKPINEICTEQMLLDCYVLKNSLLRLPVIDTDAVPPTTYTNLVNRVIGPLEMVLKALLTGQTNDLPENLKQYLPSSNRLLPDFRWRERSQRVSDMNKNV